MKRFCVFCGSKPGNDDRHRAAAETLGRLIAEAGDELVFGGGSVGLMGVVADAALNAGGHVIGVLPRMLATRELRHMAVADMRLVANMHDRKALMAELADAFIALPGGFGTFEELFEIVTWVQLGTHRKNIGLLNVAGYYDPLVNLIDHAIDAGFISPANRELIVVADEPAGLLKLLADHQLPPVRQWLGPEAT